MSSTPPQFGAGSRFSIRRFLGEGGFGVVYEAYDAHRQGLVALKTLRHLTPESLYRLKREFRSLADLRHVNLVEFHELLLMDDTWFITMELVDGVNFLRWVRPSSTETIDAGSTTQTYSTPPAGQTEGDTPRETPHGAAPAAAVHSGRLRDALRQLCVGVSAVHGAGRLHRDLKPQNVLVTPEGRVVILDFGLITELAPGATQTDLEFGGTPAFMAPEQMTGQATAASDWYSVGVMLCQALTGALPFQGPLPQMLADKTRDDFEPAGLVEAQPRDLAGLSIALMRAQPERRPGQKELLATVGGSAASPVSSDQMVGDFVGRHNELQRLRTYLDLARQGRAVVVRLRGESGVGKSALARTFVREAMRTRHTLNLLGGCFERESVPFRALDSIVDALSRFLKRLPEADVDALLPRDPGALARLFPVLDRVAGFARAPKVDIAGRDSIQERRTGFASLRELLGRVASRRTVVIHIDDAQWGDADSAYALLEVLRPPDPPPLVLLLTYRPETEARGFLPTLEREMSREGTALIEDIELHPLDQPTAKELVARLLPAETEASVAAIAREAGGNPLLIGELVRELRLGGGGGDASFAALVANRVARLSALAGSVLEVIAVAGQPLPLETARRAAQLPHLTADMLHELESLHLARVVDRHGAKEIECHHDRIRQAVVEALPRDRATFLHGQLGLAFEATQGPAEALAVHFEASGDAKRAADYALQAAGQAAGALAFDRAVRLYETALRLMGDDNPSRRRDILITLGDAFVNAGLGYEAAKSYMAADEMSRDESQLELRRRAVHQLLVSGHVEEGLVLARQLLAAIGMPMPSTRLGTLIRLVLYRLQLGFRGMAFQPKPPDRLRLPDLVRLDTCFSLAIGLSIVDTPRGALFQARQALMALRLGEPARVARALALEAGYRSIGGRSAHRTVMGLLDQARRIATELGDATLQARCTFAEGVIACESADWRRGVERCDLAAQAFRTLPGVRWERVTAQVLGLFALYCLGEWTDYALRSQSLTDEARERGDLYGQSALAHFVYARYLARDDPATAVAQHLEAASKWTNSRLDIQRFWHTYALCEIDLYRDDGLAACHRVLDVWPKLRKSLLLHVQPLHIFAQYLKGRCGVAAAVAGHVAMLATARSAARAIEKQGVAWATPFAHMIRAGLASVEGRRIEVAAHLESARTGLIVANMQPWLAAVTYCQLQSDLQPAGAARQDWLVKEAVRNPGRFAALMLPGVRSPASS